MNSLKIVLFWLTVGQCIFAQNSEIVFDGDSSSISKPKTSRPAYLDMAFGVHHSIFRDFGTSPQFYTGTPIYVALSHVDLDEKRESGFRMSYSFGDFVNRPVEHKTTSKVRMISLNYFELFRWQRLSSSKINVKVGGQINSTFNIRDNPALGNNRKGFEIISTVFGSVKGTIDISQKERRRQQRKKGILSSLLKKSHVSLGLHIGLINSSYRNGFIYTRQSPLLNQDNINEGYRFQLFSGYRLNSSIDYTSWLKNGNAIQLSYLWDIYRTGGGAGEFEMAAHVFRLSILFNLK